MRYIHCAYSVALKIHPQKSSHKNFDYNKKIVYTMVNMIKFMKNEYDLANLQ